MSDSDSCLYLQDLAQSLFHRFQIFRRNGSQALLQSPLGDGSNLIHHGDDRSTRAINRDEMGGAACREVESGMTTTVRRRWLTMLVVSTRQGRVFLISEPTVGSRRTHQTSPRMGPRWRPRSGPRRGPGPRLRDFPREGVEFIFNGPYLGIVVGDFAGPDKLAVPFGQLLGKGLRQVARTLAGRNPPGEPGCQLLRQCERHLPRRHSAILPYCEVNRGE